MVNTIFKHNKEAFHYGKQDLWICSRIHQRAKRGSPVDCPSRISCFREMHLYGHTVDKISLNKTEVKGCIGCNACRYGKPCVQKDGFNDLIPKIKTADLIVFASPLLFWTLSSKIKAFIERFYCIAEEDQNPPLGRYERYPVKDAALLMTSADNYFWTYEQAISYYKFAMINYIGFQDKGMLLAGGCGDTNGKPQIDKTNHLRDAYNFGKNIYRE
ncbi:NAD(P)H-dependent oxidoreductase [[Clostridium] scindens]|uniref:flavodoxin family protein n=1 Tax=Clostridium scindens (strain JCM 10418 / VPI 12708) TaxID=29347 RepID=UPI001D091C1F|nr:flavodoxin family protein [[Clostridium] scindens]MCB6646943.1 NAD(P)H-dependent oxidoreductase [[Clostridium] scindens]